MKYSRVKDVWMLVVATVAVPISCLNGLASVDMLDVSAKNVKTCIQFANELGVQEKVRVQQSTLEEIPFQDGYFDFVWCNGVIMHI